ncbi:MAG: hypothetical protein K8S94_11160 [Planctomycetia bacterium]|nr:hypothetical protein [Planctomycetia bacterium]
MSVLAPMLMPRLPLPSSVVPVNAIDFEVTKVDTPPLLSTSRGFVNSSGPPDASRVALNPNLKVPLPPKALELERINELLVFKNVVPDAKKVLVPDRTNLEPEPLMVSPKPERLPPRTRVEPLEPVIVFALGPKFMPKPIVFVPLVMLFVMLPSSVSAFPLRVNPLELNVMLVAVPLVRSFVFDRPLTPVNTYALVPLFTGAVPSQLAAVLQLVFAPVPVQVI